MVKRKETKAELLEEVKYWRQLFGNLSPDVGRLLYAIGSEIEVRYRNYTTLKGILKGVEFTPKSLEIVTSSEQFEQSGERFVTESVRNIPFSSLVDMMFLSTRKAWQERDK